MLSLWHSVANVEDVPSPALLLYPDRVEGNIQRMIALAGGPGRLRPHVKTHKLPEIIRMQLQAGMTKFKCATIAEAEMTAGAGAKDVLLAFPQVGANVARLVRLVQRFPETRFSTIGDDDGALEALARAFSSAQLTLPVRLDLDCGMHRTGIEPGEKAFEFYRLIEHSSGVQAGGLHAYDGHIHATDLKERAAEWESAWAPVKSLRDKLLRAGLRVPVVVAGGTPTFALHARQAEVECSPGTCVFWDFGYSNMLPDLDFQVAALVLARVVSKPSPNRLCLDLGHKAIAAENPHPRVQFLEIPDAKAVMHSEEHLVIETDRAGEFAVGTPLYGIPRHICPTVALHAQAVVVTEGRATERWRITARDRVLTI